MTTAKTKMTDEALIRALLDEWADGVRKKNVEQCVSHHAPDIRLFDLAPPLQFIGAKAYRQGLEGWFPTFDGPIDFEVRDLQISVSGDAAFCHSLNRIGGKRTNGEETDVWVRATVCFRKRNGEWMVTHEHVSVPFHMDGSYKAAVDLTP